MIFISSVNQLWHAVNIQLRLHSTGRPFRLDKATSKCMGGTEKDHSSKYMISVMLSRPLDRLGTPKIKKFDNMY